MAKKTEVNYQQLQEKLDGLIEQLESGELGLDEAIHCYQEALDILKQLEAYLQTAENRVTQLTGRYQAEA
jgi:exodeoxyribonuclease VII small subunit